MSLPIPRQATDIFNGLMISECSRPLTLGAEREAPRSLRPEPEWLDDTDWTSRRDGWFCATDVAEFDLDDDMEEIRDKGVHKSTKSISNLSLLQALLRPDWEGGCRPDQDGVCGPELQSTTLKLTVVLQRARVRLGPD